MSRAALAIFCSSSTIASGSPRRALLRFDLSSIPSNATINAVTLRFVIDRAAIGSRLDDQARLHKVLAAWSEGNSNGGTGGAGTPAASGDATWNVRFFGALPSAPWTQPGGDFAVSASSSITIGGLGSYTVPSTPSLVQDVQNWLLTPASNFGWILIGPEGNDVSQRARRLYSRTSAAVDSRPQLQVDFSLPITLETHSVPIPQWALSLLAAVLIGRRGIGRYRRDRPYLQLPRAGDGFDPYPLADTSALCRSLPQAAATFITAFTSRNSSKPNSPHSRPLPDCL